MLVLLSCQATNKNKYVISNSFDLVDSYLIKKTSSRVEENTKSNIYLTSDLILAHPNGTSIGSVYYKIEVQYRKPIKSDVFFYKKLVNDLVNLEYENEEEMFRFETLDTILKLPYDYPPTSLTITLMKNSEKTLVRRARIKIFTDSKTLQPVRE